MDLSAFFTNWQTEQNAGSAEALPGGDPLIAKAIRLARCLQVLASQRQTAEERRQQAELDRMIRNPHDRATLTQLTDQAFRARAADRAADQLVHILDAQGIPRFFNPLEQTLMRGFQSFGAYLPEVAVPLVKDKMRRETANVILPAEEGLLSKYLRERQQAQVRMNVNFLGEALLGEADAQRRLQGYLAALQWPAIEVISVKISTIFSQVSAFARRHTIDVLCDRLELLYRAASREQFLPPSGKAVPKFVYLDMEEYRDLSLTAMAFMETLDRPGLAQTQAGIALQAYLPDSWALQKEIYAWARLRVANGGAPITVRLVKGANMEMERVESSIQGWPQAPYLTKQETDANYKRMIQTALEPCNLSAARLGIASHNLFDVAYAMVLGWESRCLDRMQFEMLEGMANAQRRALSETALDVLLYAPACRQEDFLHAIGYLIRRLDENAGPENFLRYAFRIHVDSPEWQMLEQAFIDACQCVRSVDASPRRRQNRNLSPITIQPLSPRWQEFQNEPDTDFSLPHHESWIQGIINTWIHQCDANAPLVPCVISGEEHFDNAAMGCCFDPSRPGVCASRYTRASTAHIDRAVDCAQHDLEGWRLKSASERRAILEKVAERIADRRTNLIGAALSETGKLIPEGDAEVSEAIDFVRFYSRTAEFFQTLPRVRSQDLGAVVVVSPWNFPIAIPCGGVAAALATGNRVILKPASASVLVAYELCQCFWQAGISKQTLQFAPCSGNDVASYLIGHPGINAAILTGGTETAQRILQNHPRLTLLAETGGKNATIVTAMSDRDQAIKHVVHSAFSHSGQKCSATSLCILEQEVYYDRGFRETLCDAAASRIVGSAWDLSTTVGPLIRAPSGPLERGLKELEHGESWALLPHISVDNRQLVSPGIKWDVRAGSFTHLTEFFGPLLAVMPARHLREAIHIAQQTGYGLTAGLESLDDREQTVWQESMPAGNLYINRPTTGAMVLRQPFGGWGKSCFGPGFKAGGPNYVVPLLRFESISEETSYREIRHPELATWASELLRPHPLISRVPIHERRQLVGILTEYDAIAESEFSVSRDYFHLLGQDNLVRFRPFRAIRVRVDPADTFLEVITRIAAARVVGCHTTISTPLELDSPLLQFVDDVTQGWGAHVEFVEETDEELAEILLTHQTERVRYTPQAAVPEVILRAAIESGVYLARAPISHSGRIELLHYVREQSLCVNYHRYGNLGIRATELRHNPA